MTDRTRARALAAAAIARGEPVAWFEELYRAALRGDATVPWVDRVPNPHVVAWLDRKPVWRGRALDVGTGLGDTAEELARRGLSVVAFDVSRTAVQQAGTRFPESKVDYRVADVLDLPPSWTGAFDLVVECYTLQVLPPRERARAVAALRGTLAPGGTLLVVARGREPSEPEGSMPWPLTRAEVEAIATRDVRLRELEDFCDDESPPVRRFRTTFVR